MRNGFFPVLFFPVLFFALAVLGVGISFILGYKCYTSGDPTNIACYMISERHEIGIRQR